MNLDSLISDLALILIVAAIVTILFKKLKQPVVLGYIVAGFLISPNFTLLPTVVASEDIHVWANIGAVFLMFGLGLEFSFKKIATVGGSAFIIAMTVMGSMILIGTGVGSLMGWEKMDCIFLGGMLSMSSTMIILKAYEEYDLKQKKFAQLVLGTLVIEDIAGIFMLIVLSTISVSQNVSGLMLIRDIGLLMVYLAIWLLAGIYLIPSVLKWVSKLLTDELLLLFSVGLCLGMVVVANYIGFSSALGAFLAGSILAGTVQSARIERIVTPVKDLFGGIFFVSVGMLIEPHLLIEYLVPIAVITVVTILGQMLFSTIGILLSGQSLQTAIQGGFSMVQIGEFSFIVATLGMSLGVISDFLYPVVVCVSVITSFTTPIFIKNAEKVYQLLERVLPNGMKIFIRKNTSEHQIHNDKDKDWYDYIKKVLLRMVLCSVILFLIYWVGTRYLDPVMYYYLKYRGLSDVVCVVAIGIAMTPFIALMHGTNDALYTKLWLKHRYNRFPLLTLKWLRILIAACFLSLVVRHFFRIPFVILMLFAVFLSIWIIRSDYIKGKTLNMEMRFLSNFSEKTLEKEKKERGLKGQFKWINESLFVAEFQVTDTSQKKTILDFARDRAFRVTIIRIIRGYKIMNLPAAMDEVQEGDLLHMMGTMDEIDACTMLLEKEDCIEYTDHEDECLKDYIYSQTFYGIPKERQLLCCPIPIDASSEFVKKSIKNSGIRDRYRGNVIGIERGNLPIISPDIDTVIQEGDLIWALGTERMANSLIKGDIFI